jgi:hypothetical protein
MSDAQIINRELIHHAVNHSFPVASPHMRPLIFSWADYSGRVV